MTRIIVKELIWDVWNTVHIKKHSVTKKETENAIENVIAYRQGYKERIVLIGRSGKRLLAMIVSKEMSGRYYVVTARDAGKKERRLAYEKEKNKQNTKI